MGSGGEDGEPADIPPVEAAEAVTQAASSCVSSRFRTEDVQANKRFQDLALPDRMVTALNRCGFFQPSPVQESAIPLGLLGSDLIVQAKSGTGKTLVFSIICLSRVKRGSSATQALILAPTREVAIQSEQVITRLAAQLYDLELSQPTASSSLALQATRISPPSLAAADASCTAAAGPGAGSPTGAGVGAGAGACSPVTVACFVGGLPVAGDEKKLRRSCQVVVGTPGRLVQLVGSGVLACESVSMLVLDEADALMGDSFYCDVTWLYDNLPRKKQVVACSATFTPDLLADLEPLVKRPQRVMMCDEEEKVSLKGVRQFYHLLTPESSTATAASTATTTSPAASTVTSGSPGGVNEREELQRKVAVLMQLLTSCSFHQAAVFCNNKPQGEWLARLLTSRGLPAAFLAAGVAQEERGAIMAAMRAFKLRLVVSTDVLARGVDLERVNLVVNLDLPRDAATYVHRVGRTGRFGTRGVSVTLLTSPSQLTQLTTWLAEVGGGSMEPLPPGAALPPDLYAYELKEEWEQAALQQLHAAPQLPAPDLPAKAGAGGQAQSPEHGNGPEPPPLPAPAPAPVPTPPLACGYAPGPSTSWPPLISQEWGGWAQAGGQQQLPQHQQEALQRYWQLFQHGKQPHQHWGQQHQQQQLVHNPGFEYLPLPQQHLQQLGQQKQSLPPWQPQPQPLAEEQSQAMPPAHNNSATMYSSALQEPGQQQGPQAGVAAAAAGGSLLGFGPAPSVAAGAAAAGEHGQGCVQQGSHGAAGAADQAGVAGTGSAQEWAAWAALSPEQQREAWAAWTAWEQQQQQQQQQQDQCVAWQRYWVQQQELQQRYGQQQPHHHHTESALPLHQLPHGGEQGQHPQQLAAAEQLPSQAPDPQWAHGQAHGARGLGQQQWAPSSSAAPPHHPCPLHCGFTPGHLPSHALKVPPCSWHGGHGPHPPRPTACSHHHIAPCHRHGYPTPHPCCPRSQPHPCCHSRCCRLQQPTGARGGRWGSQQVWGLPLVAPQSHCGLHPNLHSGSPAASCQAYTMMPRIWPNGPWSHTSSHHHSCPHARAQPFSQTHAHTQAHYHPWPAPAWPATGHWQQHVNSGSWTCGGPHSFTHPSAPTAPVSGQQAQPSVPDGSGSYPEAQRSAPAPCATDGSDTVRVPDGALAGSVTSVLAASDVPSDDDLDGHAAALLEGLQVKL